MNKYLSDKLNAISFFLMIMVVFQHSDNLTVKFQSEVISFNKGYSQFIQHFISQGITRVAVPLFFAFSGYLFFLKMEGTISEFILKFKKRIKTLLIPYILWSLWGLLLYFTLQNLSQSQRFFTNDLIANYSISKLLSTIFINPIPYQLWFVRDLIVMILVSPIIYYLIRRLHYSVVLIVLILWFFNFNFIIFYNETLLFFTLGAFVAMDKNGLIGIRVSRKKSWVYTYLWITLVLSKTTLVYIDFENAELLNLLHKVSTLIGVIAMWTLYDVLFEKVPITNYKFYLLTSFSFFLYAFHEPILSIFKKGLFYLMGRDEIVSLLIYAIAPLLTIFVGIFTGYYLKRITPKFYDLITGGR